MPTHLLAATHAATTRLEIHDVVRDLNTNLGTTLVAYLARQWLLGANPFFDGVSPADEIREGNLPAVMLACKSFVADDAGG